MKASRFILPSLLALFLASCGGTTETSSSSESSQSIEPPDVSEVTTTKVVAYEGPEILDSSSLCEIYVEDTPLFVYEVNVNHARTFSWSNSFEKNAVAIFDFEGRVDVRIELPYEAKAAYVSPLGYDIPVKVEGSTLSFTIEQPNNYVIQVDKDGDGLDEEDADKAIHLFANPLEENVPSPDDPNVVYIGPGVYDAGAIALTEGQTLYLAGGAYVYGNIRTEHVNDITIRGRGIISGEMYTRNSDSDVTCPLEIRYGSNITVEGITFLDPAGWTTIFYGCDNVNIENIKIISSRPNGDGISIQGCSNVTMDGGFVRTWDDSLVVKCNDDLSTENIAFYRVNVWTDLAQSMEVGFETHGDHISNVTFSDITVIHNYHKAAMSIHNADKADVSNITYRNITIEDGEMLGDNRADGLDDYLCDFSVEYSTSWSESTDLGNIDGVLVDNVKVLKLADSVVSRVSGYAGNHATVSNVTFRNMEIEGKKVASKEDLNLVFGTDVNEGSIKIESTGETTGAALPYAYDLTNLGTAVDVKVEETTSQDAVMVPTFSFQQGDLAYVGTPLEIVPESISVTHGAGNTFATPVDDGSGDFSADGSFPSSLLDGNRATSFESKPYTGAEHEFVGISIEFEEPVQAGTIRLLADEANAFSYVYDIEVRYKKESTSNPGTFGNYVIASGASEYSITPQAGNAVDISFTAANIKGIQLRVFRTSRALFDLGSFRLSEIEVYGPSLSYQKPVVDSTPYYDVYDPARLTDGNPNGTSYYESDGFPAYIVIDLQKVYEVKAITLCLPSSFSWDKRTQRMSFSGCAQDTDYREGLSFTTFQEAIDITFDPLLGNTYLLELDTPVAMRFLRIDIASNSIAGGYGGQLSEVYVFGSLA